MRPVKNPVRVRLRDRELCHALLEAGRRPERRRATTWRPLRWRPAAWLWRSSPAATTSSPIPAPWRISTASPVLNATGFLVGINEEEFVEELLDVVGKLAL